MLTDERGLFFFLSAFALSCMEAGGGGKRGGEREGGRKVNI